MGGNDQHPAFIMQQRFEAFLREREIDAEVSITNSILGAFELSVTHAGQTRKFMFSRDVDVSEEMLTRLWDQAAKAGG